MAKIVALGQTPTSTQGHWVAWAAVIAATAALFFWTLRSPRRE